MTLKNISKITDLGLCTGCGTCSGVCPVEAIEMHNNSEMFLPTLAKDKCTGCAICVKSCPAYSTNTDALALKIFGKQHFDEFLGNFLNCYVGHSNENQIRFDSASGGTVTGLLVYALEKGLIDGVLCTRMRKDKPLEPEPFIARTREEIISASKSKYCPVPLNSALRKIMRVERGNFAVVGLPCHIYGIRKAEAIFKNLDSRISLHVGLLCTHTVNFMGTNLLLKKFRIRNDDVISIDYRGRGWPGCMHLRLKNGRPLDVRYNKGWNAYWNVFTSFFFAPLCCFFCGDQFNELSDVSVGDAWLPSLSHHSQGESLIVARTAQGRDLLEAVAADGRLCLTPIPSSMARESQAFGLNFKKQNLGARLSLFRLLGAYRVGKKRFEKKNSSFVALLGAFLAYSSYRLSNRRHSRVLLSYVPLPIFRLYFGLFKTISYLTK